MALPSIKEFEQSQFTILDPMNISIHYVQVKQALFRNSSGGLKFKTKSWDQPSNS